LLIKYHLKKGDLGGLKNLQVERIYGKRYKNQPSAEIIGKRHERHGKGGSDWSRLEIGGRVTPWSKGLSYLLLPLTRFPRWGERDKRQELLANALIWFNPGA
jgi:hypothetical protein